MLLVILGAGASYDSVPSRPPDSFKSLPFRPPLANELFADRPLFVASMDKFEKCKPIIPYLQNLREGQTVEHLLEGLQAEAEIRPERGRQLLAVKYYLHVMLWQCEHNWNAEAIGITNYLTLLDQIEQWRRPDERVCFVTFNYDILLDRVMPTVGVKISEIADYIKHDTYKLIKIHGSINWAREVNTPLDNVEGNPWTRAYQIIDRFPEIEVSRRYCIVTECPVSTGGRIPLYPAIAIPVETKTESHFECPDDHMAALKAFLPEVKKILIVGWRGMEAHFVKILKEHLKSSGAVPTMVVSGSKESAIEIGQRLRSEILIDIAPAESGFSDFILDREGKNFLKNCRAFESPASETTEPAPTKKPKKRK
jgi:hypothetical protein